MPENDDFKNATPDTIPTLPEEEDHAPTDMISDAVEEMIDHIQDTFDGDSEEDNK